jgi:thiol-disulfide isomerase/thioredoxin
MKMKLFVLINLAFLSVSIAAQSGRTAPEAPASSPASASAVTSVKQLFDQANAYTKKKFAEFEAKKIKYSEELEKQTEREKKQLAAKYASQTQSRNDLKGDDYYYLGLLHWIAENLDGTAGSLKKYAVDPNALPDKAQTARSLIAVVEAKRGDLTLAVESWNAYQKNEPKKLTEISRMANELAKAFIAAKSLEKALPFANEAYKASKALTFDPQTRLRAIDEMVDSGMLVFEINRDQNKVAEAEAILTDMQDSSAKFGSPSFFYYASDKLITYQIETGRKPLAMETYLTALLKAGKDFVLKGHQTDAIDRLKNREAQYKLLQEPAIEFIGVDKWFPGDAKTMQALKGKVVVLDFWATWCGPCFEAFPLLSEWSRDHAAEGLVILGMTRYYMQAEGLAVDKPGEIDVLKQFKEKHKMNYDFVVFDDQRTQMAYAATLLPTAVIIDRKGKIRYIESGTSTTRLEDLRQAILRLLAEK